jgi:hypothetical protein
MYHRSMLDLGGIFAILVGVGYILVALTHFLMPRAQLRGAFGVRAAFYESLAKASTVFSIHYWLVAISSLCVSFQNLSDQKGVEVKRWNWLI